LRKFGIALIFLFCLAAVTPFYVPKVEASPSTWSIITVDTTANVGSFSSIALDSIDCPHISYYDVTNGDLKYAKWTGSSWSIETVDADGIVGYWTSIA
jgi:hypothetical protein